MVIMSKSFDHAEALEVFATIQVEIAATAAATEHSAAAAPFEGFASVADMSADAHVWGTTAPFEGVLSVADISDIADISAYTQVEGTAPPLEPTIAPQYCRFYY